MSPLVIEPRLQDPQSCVLSVELQGRLIIVSNKKISVNYFKADLRYNFKGEIFWPNLQLGVHFLYLNLLLNTGVNSL